MKKFIYLLVFFLPSINSFSQSATDLAYYKYPKQIPAKYILDPKEEYKRLKAEGLPEGWKENEFDRYCELMSFQKANSFLTGEVYLGWDDLENYLNSVLKKVVGKKAMVNNNIHAYANRNAEFNAYAIHDGTFYVNIGLLADVKDEAGLACILGHEYVHFKKNHLRRSMLERMRASTKKVRDKNEDLVLGSLHNSRRFEQEADSLGAVYAAKAGYNLKSGVNNFYQLRFMEEKESTKADADDDAQVSNDDEDSDSKTNKKDEHGDKVLSSHPDLQRRIKYFKRFVRRFNPDSAQNYIISKSVFKDLQAQARVETLNALLENFSYKTCTEKAFTYYLLDPTNDAYVYYVLEASRRAILVYKDLYKKPFLTEDYSKDVYDDLDKGILANLEILVPDTNQFKKIKATDLLIEDAKDFPFKVWEEAFAYFQKITEERNIKESYLTLALAAQNSADRKEKLIKYLSFEKVKYRSFAQALLDKRILKDLEDNKKELVVTGKVNFIEDHRYGYHSKQLMSEEKTPEYINALSDFLKKKYPAKELVMYQDMAKEDMAKAMKYRLAMLSSLVSYSLLAARKEDSDDENNSSTDDDTPKKKKKKSESDDEEFSNYEEFASPLLSTDFFAKKKKKKKKKEPEITHHFIKSDSAIQTFVLTPEVWSMFKKDNLKSLETVTTTSFEDHTKLMGLQLKTNSEEMNIAELLLCCCQPWLICTVPCIEMYSRVQRGSTKYAYQVTYYSFTPNSKNQKQTYYEETVRYKMYKPYYVNSMNNAFGSKTQE